MDKQQLSVAQGELKRELVRIGRDKQVVLGEMCKAAGIDMSSVANKDLEDATAIVRAVIVLAKTL
jgi:hypothetical protein